MTRVERKDLAARGCVDIPLQGLPAYSPDISEIFPLHKKHRGARRRVSKKEERRFLRTGLLMVYMALPQAVAEGPPPFFVKAPGTPERPATDPRDVARFLLLRTLEGWSYDKAYNTLDALPSLAEILGFPKPRGLPAPSTVEGRVARVSLSYWEELVRRTGIAFTKGTWLARAALTARALSATRAIQSGRR